MKYLKKSIFYLNKSQRFGLCLLFVLILLSEVFQNFTFRNQPYELNEDDKELLSQYKKDSKSPTKDSILPFNPNNLTINDWINLGFSTKQAEVLMNYKQVVGGEFTSKEQIKKCYIIDDETFIKLEPLLLLPEKNIKIKNNTTSTKLAITYKKFNPNDLPQQGWEKIGFSTKQAEVIMKYKQIVGGTFTSKEQLRKCYVIDDDKYAEMQPYILLQDKTKQDEKLEKKQTKKLITYKEFDPNNYSINDWKKIGFSHKQAESILKYKKILGGKFKSKEQLQKCYMISDQKFIEIEPYLMFTSSKEKLSEIQKDILNKKTTSIQKFNPNDLSKDDWLKLGFTEKQVSTIFNFKQSLGGKFTEKTLKKCYAISEEKYKEIEPFLMY